VETKFEEPNRNPPGVNEIRSDVQEWLDLAEQLRLQEGGELDDSAIQAVAEMTNTPVELVRIALVNRAPVVEEKKGLFGRLKTFYLSLDPTVRGYVTATYLACGAALVNTIGQLANDTAGLSSMLVVLIMLGALANAALSRDKRHAIGAGALFGAAYPFFLSVFLAIGQMLGMARGGVNPVWLFLGAGFGAIVGRIAFEVWSKQSRKMGLKNPTDERRELLKQLVEIQDRLRSGEQAMTFLSLDIVGSTRMKENADPLSMEFTFTEYHQYVEAIIQKHGGKVHSTAGDGVTCAFEHPAQSFAAARNIQSGLFEFNEYRNRLGVPIVLRAGIHHGSVVPQGQGVQSISFAHVIDIAAHLQKVAPEGGIAMSTTAATMLPGGVNTVGAEVVETHGVTARVWRPRAALSAPANPEPKPN